MLPSRSVYGLRLLRQRPVQLAALVLVLTVVLALRAVQFAALTGEIQWGYDFSFYWTAARNLIEGEPIYSAAQLAGPYAPQGQDGFLYPPPLAAAVTPLATLFPTDYGAANWVWAAVGALLLIVSIRSLWRSERIRRALPDSRGPRQMAAHRGGVCVPTRRRRARHRQRPLPAAVAPHARLARHSPG